MDKNAIKKYAVWARNELIARVSQKAQQYGITAGGYGDKKADSVNGVLLSATEKKQRQALIAKIDAEGFEQVMEEVAYTWFNRFTALRFMEVNNYLPSHTRVFTNEANEFKPQILADAISLELEGLDMDKVFELKNDNKDEELYKYLLIVQCNALSSILPGMFQKIADYTELLLPDYLLRAGSVIEQMISLIPENDWTDQVQIIGWLYQFYIAEPKDALINARSKYKNVDVPFVTQLFTPDWIVKFMVENSLGKFWYQHTGDDSIIESWEYFIKPENQIIKDGFNPEDISCIDPCSGSGHVLCYLFDVLVQIYEKYGYTSKDAVSLIVEKNLWGLDIDRRAVQLAYFSIMMKARQYDRRFFYKHIQPNVYVIAESNNIDSITLDYFCNTSELKLAMKSIVKDLYDASEYGSIIKVNKVDFEILFNRIAEVKNEISIYSNSILNTIVPAILTAKVLSQKYDVTCTNPPYLNASYMPDKLKKYVQDNYLDFKNDLFAVFTKKVVDITKDEGYVGLLMPYVWMFISSYEKMRTWVNDNTDISSLVQLEYNAFEAACVPVASFTLKKSKLHSFGCYIKLSEFKGAENQAPKTIYALRNMDCGYIFFANQDDFRKIPGEPIAYWANANIGKAFECAPCVEDLGSSRSGMQTGNNNLFLRLWFEVDKNNIKFDLKTIEESEKMTQTWVPQPKGGSFRRWYGN